MTNRNWKLLELYPEFKNKDIITKLSSKDIRYNIVMEGFIKANITDEESKDFEQMAFVHQTTIKQDF